MGNIKSKFNTTYTGKFNHKTGNRTGTRIFKNRKNTNGRNYQFISFVHPTENRIITKKIKPFSKIKI